MCANKFGIINFVGDSQFVFLNLDDDRESTSVWHLFLLSVWSAKLVQKKIF